MDYAPLLMYNGRSMGTANAYSAAVVLILLVWATPAWPAPVHDEAALALVSRMETAFAGVHDYTATFLKQERVNGELLPQETITYRFKKPFMVYMGWQKGPNEGREALYVRGKYDNQVVGHEGGWLGVITLHMDPNGSVAMKGNRHPITDSGIGRLVEIVSDNVSRAVKDGDLTFTGPVNKKVFGRDTDYYVAKLPEGKNYYGAKIELWVDSELGLPIKIKIYGWNGELWESYGYKDLVINPGLTDSEFSEDYEGYDF